MLFKLLIPFILAAVIGVRATPDFHFPDVIHRDDIPVGITVHEYNATAAALGAAAAPKVEPRESLEERSDCHGSGDYYTFVQGNDCFAASMVGYGKETQTQTSIPRGNSLSQLRGVLCGLADPFLVIRFAIVLRYDADACYCGYTSRYIYRCTAICRCLRYTSCLRGSLLQNSFDAIYAVQGYGLSLFLLLPRRREQLLGVALNQIG